MPMSSLRDIVGFVPQEDTMHRELTVEENLSLNAAFRLPSSTTAAEKRAVVEATIMTLGLNDIRGSRIGDEEARGISGGQRKRVNIGMELVADPTVLFLDEPTSGLDSTSSRDVTRALHRVSRRGLTVILVLHQPSYEICKVTAALCTGSYKELSFLLPRVPTSPFLYSLSAPNPNPDLESDAHKNRTHNLYIFYIRRPTTTMLGPTPTPGKLLGPKRVRPINDLLTCFAHSFCSNVLSLFSIAPLPPSRFCYCSYGVRRHRVPGKGGASGIHGPSGAHCAVFPKHRVPCTGARQSARFFH